MAALSSDSSTLLMTNYEYFCGANVSIAIDDFDIYEVAGISYNEMDSKQPIYGYCSRLFDAVAPGQKIIQGSLVVNFKEPDYLFKVIRAARIDARRDIGEALDGDDDSDSTRLAAEAAKPRGAWAKKARPKNTTAYRIALIKQLNDLRDNRKELWSQPVDQGEESAFGAIGRDPLSMGNLRIQIRYGTKWQMTLHSVFFISRGSTIQIDESTILEEYSFFAREKTTGIIRV